jgi:hypothetical protein
VLSDPADPGEPDERTPESVDVPPRAEISRRRVRIVLAVLILVLVAIGAALLIWGLSR